MHEAGVVKQSRRLEARNNEMLDGAIGWMMRLMFHGYRVEIGSGR